MKTFHIAGVRRIAQGKQDANGVKKTINIIVIALTNGKSIVRNYTQFIEDLKGSFLISDNVNSIDHPQVRKCLKELKKGTVDGDIAFNKKGDKWIVSEFSRMVTDPTHPKFNTVAVGDVQVFEEDSTRVEGFLDFTLNDVYRENEVLADKQIEAKQALRGMFEDFGINTASDNMPSEDYDDVPTGAFEEALDTLPVDNAPSEDTKPNAKGK